MRLPALAGALRHAQLRGARGADRKLAQLVAEGKDHEQIIAALHRRSSAARTSWPSPVDKGFNRLAWLFPYLIGASGAAMVGVRGGAVVARAPRRRAAGDRAAASDDPALQSRLDDELRDLD